jgi:hypothetical protein
MNEYLVSFFRDPKVNLLSSDTITASTFAEAIAIFEQRYGEVSIMYIYDKKYAIWKNV